MGERPESLERYFILSGKYLLREKDVCTARDENTFVNNTTGVFASLTAATTIDFFRFSVLER